MSLASALDLLGRWFEFAQRRRACRLGQVICDGSHVAPFLSPCPSCGAAL